MAELSNLEKQIFIISVMNVGFLKMMDQENALLCTFSLFPMYIMMVIPVRAIGKSNHLHCFLNHNFNKVRIGLSDLRYAQNILNNLIAKAFKVYFSHGTLLLDYDGDQKSTVSIFDS